MGYRYRISIDICDKDGISTGAMLGEIQEAMLSAAKVTIPSDKGRQLKPEKVVTDGSVYHSHDGVNECSGCYKQAEDGKDGNVEAMFAPTIIGT